MDKRRFCLVILFFMLPLPAHADRHKIGGRVAYEEAKRSSLRGWQVSGEIPLGHEPRVAGQDAPPPEKRTLSAVFEGSIVEGEHEDEDLVQITYLSGLRYSFNHPMQRYVQFYVQTLVGGSHDSTGEIRDQPLAKFGVGLLVPVKHWWAFSLEIERCVLMAGSKEWYTKGSLGFVWRLEN